MLQTAAKRTLHRTIAVETDIMGRVMGMEIGGETGERNRNAARECETWQTVRDKLRRRGWFGFRCSKKPWFGQKTGPGLPICPKVFIEYNTRCGFFLWVLYLLGGAAGIRLACKKERLPAIIEKGRQPCDADGYLVKSRYKFLYCFAEFSQDRFLSISRCTISSQHQRFSK